MANIPNPLTGTKVNGSTFTAPECNAVGLGLTRAAVNDGTTDLRANASFSGGGNKSFGFVGVTDFYVEASSSLNLSATDLYAFGESVIIESGVSLQLQSLQDVVVTPAQSFTVNSSNDIDLNAPSEITADAPLITLTGTTNVKTDAGKMLFTGSGYPKLETRNLPACRPPWSFVNSFKHPTGEQVFGWINETLSPFSGFKQLIAQVSGDAAAQFLFTVPPGAVLRGCSLRFRGYGTASTIPLQRPSIALYTVGVDGATTQHGTVTDTAANYAAYSAYHALTITLGAPVVIAAGQLVVVQLFGAGSTNWATQDERFQVPTLNLDVNSLQTFG